MKIPISVLVVIYNTSGDVLLIERADRHNFWQSVTGSLDDLNESLRAAAEREVFEETGIQVAALNPTALQDMHHQVEYEIYPQWRHRYAAGVTKNSEHWFSLLVPQDCRITLAPQEHIAYEWLLPELAASKCFSESNRLAIETLFKQAPI
ncbi:MAG: dihydroneopterin triphosphate diphosphatase [Burkholderiaceae bacterium]|nr:dihydroneopterin triphosphate diphosphatase [Burkholderiaceae bacterium]